MLAHTRSTLPLPRSTQAGVWQQQPASELSTSPKQPTSTRQGAAGTATEAAVLNTIDEAPACGTCWHAHWTLPKYVCAERLPAGNVL
jgi:hypothetical protein